ncbi:Early nodulin-like protein 1 precursor [Dorcoceras hygrometricum]|uniref:Early nodulin-like protein 1 n=1 Tax=Dorcoceras hygrometricum TaxID=472368 RepID=A0A2Z7AI37_9LAMI|nr:Early nodulin-like protein 1 precursor [Dorcoceras hygrometricum]
MAGCFSRTKISSVLLLLCLFFFSLSEARVYPVGGKDNAWRVPSSEAESLNHWSEKSRFLIGDSLVFEYDGSKDSVLLVTKEDYLACNTTSPVASYRGGNTTVKLERSGPYYFISGEQGNCVKGQKLIVVVISERHSKFTAGAPAPSEGVVPAAAPTSGGGRLHGELVVGFVAALVGSLVI